MSGEPWSGVSSSGLFGVREAARAHGLVRNRRGPSAWPSSGKDRGYKPMVKASGGQRESDGVVVPVIGVQHNAPGGKGPDFDHAGRVGKREGMTGTARSNNPGGPSLAVADGEPLVASPVKVRELQRTLWAAAKQSEGRRFHALYDRVHRGDVLWEAWERVRENRGAAGVDRVTLVAVEDYGVDRMLRELRRDLRAGRYRPAPVRRVEIPKPEVVSGRWVFRRCVTGWPSRRPRSCWNRFSRRTSCRARMGFGRSGRRRRRWSDFASGSSRGSLMWWSSTSRTSSARSTTTGCSTWWVGGCRIGGCSSCCGCGCRRV